MMRIRTAYQARRIVLVALALIISLALPGVAAAVTIEEVIALHDAGVGDQVIKDLVVAGGDTYDLDVQDVLKLKKAGLSDDLISFLIKRTGPSGSYTPTASASPAAVPTPAPAPGSTDGPGSGAPSPGPAQGTPQPGYPQQGYQPGYGMGYEPPPPSGQLPPDSGQQVRIGEQQQGLPPPAPTSQMPAGAAHIGPYGASSNPDEAEQPPAPTAQFPYNQRFVSVFELKVYKKRPFMDKRLLNEGDWDRVSNKAERAGSLFFTDQSIVFVNALGVTVLDIPYTAVTSQRIIDQHPAEHEKQLHKLTAYKLQIEFTQNNEKLYCNILTLPKSKKNRDPEWGTVFDIAEALHRYGGGVNPRIKRAEVVS